VAERVGLHPTDYKALSALQRRGPLTAGALADTTGLTTGSVTALVDRLARRGLVRRLRDPADGRRVVVEVTEQAIDAVMPFVAAPEHSPEPLYESYTTDQLDVICDFLARSAERLRRATKSLGG
jgi:DNA-binding MarR family transcriptional regulator